MITHASLSYSNQQNAHFLSNALFQLLPTDLKTNKVPVQLLALTVHMAIISLGATQVHAAFTPSVCSLNCNTAWVSNETIDGRQYIQQGGHIQNSRLVASGIQIILDGGEAYDIHVEQGSYQFVSDFGRSINSTIFTGGRSTVNEAGLALDTVILGGVQSVNDDGEAHRTHVVSGNLNVRGHVSDALIERAGRQSIDGPGTAIGTQINGGEQEVGNNGKATGTVLRNGGLQNVRNDGHAYDTYVAQGSLQHLNWYGNATGTTLDNGKQIVSSHSIAIDTRVKSGSEQHVEENGKAIDTEIEHGGQQLIGYSSSAENTWLKGGQQTLYGSSQDMLITDGGKQLITGGYAYDTQIHDGIQSVTKEGYAIHTEIDGGIQHIDGGYAKQTSIRGDSTQIVTRDSRVFSTEISSGGKQIIEAGGFASMSEIHSDGLLRLESGAEVFESTVHDGGTLEIINGAILGGINHIEEGGLLLADSIVLKEYARLRLDGDRTVDANISGNGYLIKSGNGELVLSGHTTMNTDIHVESGSLRLENAVSAGKHSIWLGEDTALKLAFDGRLDNDIYGYGATLYKQGDGTVELTDYYSLGKIVIEQGALILDRPDQDAPPWTTQPLPPYLWPSFPPYYWEDTWQYNRIDVYSRNGIDILRGATLGGNGTLYGSVLVSQGAILSPGTSGFGTINILGDLTFEPGSQYQVSLNPNDGEHGDKTRVTGTARLAGTLLHDAGATRAEDWSNASRSWSVLRALGGIEGSFDEVSSTLALLYPVLHYEGRDVMLSFRRQGDFGDFATSRNEQQLASALNGLATDSTLNKALLNNMTYGNSRSLYNQMTAEFLPSLNGALLREDQEFAQSLLRNSFQSRVQRTVTASSTEQPTGVWVQTYGGHDHADTDGNAAGSTLSRKGITVGYHAELANDWLAGTAFRYGDGDFKLSDGRRTDVDIDSYSFALYGGRTFPIQTGELRFTGGIGYSRHDAKSKREVKAGHLAEKLKADYNADAYQVFGEAAHTLRPTETTLIEPFVNLSWNRLDADGFREKGGLTALRASSSHAEITTGRMGVRGSTYLFDQLTLDAELSWVHAFGSLEERADIGLAGTDMFRVRGNKADRNAMAVSLGASVPLGEDVTLQLSYQGRFGEDNRTHGGNAQLTWRW